MAWLVWACVVAGGIAGAEPAGAVDPVQVPLRGGPWEAVLCNNAANARGGGSGFKVLRHSAYPTENLYGNAHVGLNFEHIFNGAAADHGISMFTPRKDPVQIVVHGDGAASLVWPRAGSSWGVSAEQRYTLQDDAVHIEFSATLHEPRYPLGFCAMMWASYMNHTRERRIHFYGVEDGQEGWVTFGDDTADGFETGTIRHRDAPPLPYEAGAQLLNLVEHPTKQFVLPFYYGLIDGDGDPATQDDTMAYIVMFDQRAPIRFALWNFIRGADGTPDPHQPAWDWQFVVRDPEPGGTYGYRAQIVYAPFVSAEDVRARYEAWAAPPAAP